MYPQQDKCGMHVQHFDSLYLPLQTRVPAYVKHSHVVQQQQLSPDQQTVLCSKGCTPASAPSTYLACLHALLQLQHPCPRPEVSCSTTAAHDAADCRCLDQRVQNRVDCCICHQQAQVAAYGEEYFASSDPELPSVDLTADHAQGEQEHLCYTTHHRVIM